MLCCFFDLDGTLVDSRKPILRSLDHAFEAVGLDPIHPEEIDEFVGPPLHEQIPLYLKRIHKPSNLTGDIVSAFRAEYEVACVAMAELYPGIREVVPELADASPLAIVTSKPILYAELILESVGLRHHFRVIEGIDPDHAEPKAATLRRALNRMGELADCSEAVMIGDRLHDIAAGRQVGVRTVGVTWGHGSENELVAAGADLIVRSSEELLRSVGHSIE